MTVYVDLLFGLNMTLNYLLLRGSAAMGGGRTKLWRLLGAAALGGLYAVAVVLPGLEPLQGLFFQFLSAVGMVLFAFGWKKSTVKQGIFFLALSFALGGTVLLLVQAVEPDCVILGGHAYYVVSTPALLLLAGLSYGLAAIVLRGSGMYTGGDVVSMAVVLNGNKVETKALRDTGNVLRDPISGENIPIASWQVLKGLLPEAKLQQKDMENPAELMAELQSRYPRMRFRLITYDAVGISCGLLLAVRCTVQTGKRSGSAIVAFSPTELSADGQFEILTGGTVT